MRPALVPFADDATVVNLAGLSFENGTACIAVHGSLDLTRDRAGLTHAQTLRSLLDAIVTALEAVPDLPETVREAATQQTRTVANPFA